MCKRFEYEINKKSFNIQPNDVKWNLLETIELLLITFDDFFGEMILRKKS